MEPWFWATHGSAIFAAVIYVGLSVLLMSLNSYLVQPDVFPFAMVLTFLHMSGCCVLCWLLLLVRPALFPAFDRACALGWHLWPRVVPVGLCFAVTLYCSTLAFKYAPVSILQFIRQWNLMFVFLISCVVGLQSMTRVKFLIVVWVTVCSFASIVSTIQAAWLGIVIQLLATSSDASKVVLGDFLMNRSQVKFDPLTYLLFTAPVCLVVLLIGSWYTWTPEIPLRFREHWSLLTVNILAAFALNVASTTVVQRCSAVGFLFVCRIKDVVIVGSSCWLTRTSLTQAQWIAWPLSLIGICAWVMVKLFPDHAVVKALERATCTPQTAKADGEDALAYLENRKAGARTNKIV